MINPYNPPDVGAIGDELYIRLNGTNTPTTGTITFGAQTVFNSRPRFNADLELAQGVSIRAQIFAGGPYQPIISIVGNGVQYGVATGANRIAGRGVFFSNAYDPGPGEAGNFSLTRTSTSFLFNTRAGFPGIFSSGLVSIFTYDDDGVNISPNKQLVLASGTTSVVPMQFQTGTLATTPVAGGMEFTENTLFFTPNVDRRSVVLANEPVTADVTVANTVTETDLYDVTLAANSLRVGKRIEIWLAGIYSTANASDTATIRVYAGATLLTSLVTVANNVTDEPWHLTCDVQVRSLGASGTIVFHTDFMAGNNSTHDASTTPITLDTTITDDITVTVEWDNANTDNSFTLTMGDVTIKN